MLQTWVRAVRSVIPSSVAISLLLRPWPTRLRTSSSRSVSASTGCCSVRGAHALGEDPGRRRVEMDLVVVGRPDRGGDVVRLGVLEDEPAGAGLERGEDLLLLDERRQRDDLDRRLGGLDPADRADPVELGHDDVHQDHVGDELGAQLDALDSPFSASPTTSMSSSSSR